MIHKRILVKICDTFCALKSHPLLLHIDQRSQIYLAVRNYCILILNTRLVFILHLTLNLMDWWNSIVFIDFIVCIFMPIFIKLIVINVLSWSLIISFIDFDLWFLTAFNIDLFILISYIFKRASELFLLNRFAFDIVVLLNIGVKPVFYFILWTSWNLFRYLWPFWSDLRK